MKPKNSKTKEQILLDFILIDGIVCSYEEYKLTIYFLSLLCKENTEFFMVYINELLEGVDWINGTKRIQKYQPVGLTEDQILEGVAAINHRGILRIKPIEATNYGFSVSLNKKQINHENQNYK